MNLVGHSDLTSDSFFQEPVISTFEHFELSIGPILTGKPIKQHDIIISIYIYSIDEMQYQNNRQRSDCIKIELLHRYSY